MLEMCYLREIVPHKLAQHWPLSKLIPKDTRYGYFLWPEVAIGKQLECGTMN